MVTDFISIDNYDPLDSWDGRYNGQGYPTVKTGGIHYNNKWNDDKQSINGNYKILQLNVNGESARDRNLFYQILHILIMISKVFLIRFYATGLMAVMNTRSTLLHP